LIDSKEGRLLLLERERDLEREDVREETGELPRWSLLTSVAGAWLWAAMVGDIIIKYYVTGGEKRSKGEWHSKKSTNDGRVATNSLPDRDRMEIGRKRWFP
jgi:hypothetical protein